MTTEDAILELREAAIKKGDFCRPTKKDHRLHRKMAEAFPFLQSKGEEGQKVISDNYTSRRERQM